MNVPVPRLRAVLFDVGGPLDREETHERLADADIRAALATAGRAVDDAAYAAACARAVRSFASNAYRAIVWQLCDGEATLAAQVYAEVERRAPARAVFEPRPGIAEVLAWLRGRGLLLGLVANQPRSVHARLAAHGLAHFFSHSALSGDTGLHKPDPRLFLAACAGLAVSPAACVMAGDRIDNDIAPARALGMRTILLRTGRHRAQQPRDWTEIPDYEVSDVAGLRHALATLLDAAPSG